MHKEQEVIQILVGGSAGSGSLTAGAILGRALVRMGYHVVGVNEYPSIIRGGHTAYWVRAGTSEVYELDKYCDYVIAMDPDTFTRHEKEFTHETIVIYDTEQLRIAPPRGVVYTIPLRKLLREHGLQPISMNMIAVGAAAALIGIPLDYIHKGIEDQFYGRRKVIDLNKKAATIGYEYASTKTVQKSVRLKPPRPWGERIYVTGNEAITLGLIKSGVKFYAAYPMTPASPILHYMINVSREKDIIVIQAESEIAAAQMVLGAAWAGVRAATATSGGGFALMNETLSMAGMVEVPIVIILAMRAGPSTGMATMNGQEDILYAVFAGHGEFTKIVVAPEDQYHAYTRVIEVFNLAEKYRVPAIILEDKHLAESHRSVKAFPEEVVIERGPLLYPEEATKKIREGWVFKPYELTDTGVSPWVIPGTPGVLVKSDGNEHDEYGFRTIDPEIASKMYMKRLRKKELILREIEGKYNPIRVYGVDVNKADLIVFSIGSACWAVLEAKKYLDREGIKISVIQPVYLSPFPTNTFNQTLGMNRDKMMITVEYNATGLLGKLIALETGVRTHAHIGKVDGRPFRALDLAQKIKSLYKR